MGPNPFGGFLGLAALLLIFLPPEGIPRWLRWTGLLGVLVALAATYSRMGWVFLLLGLVVLGWRERKMVVAVGVAAAVAVCLAVPAIRERAVPFTVPQDKLEQSGEGYESFEWRRNNWDGLLDQWKERPLFGYGLRTTQYVNPRRVTEDRGEASGGFDAHNMVVRILVEGGIVLLLVYIAFFGVLIASVRRLLRGDGRCTSTAGFCTCSGCWSSWSASARTTRFAFTTLLYAMLALTGALEGAYRYWSRHEPEADAPEDRSGPGPRFAPGRAGAGSGVSRGGSPVAAPPSVAEADREVSPEELDLRRLAGSPNAKVRSATSDAALFTGVDLRGPGPHRSSPGCSRRVSWARSAPATGR